MLPSPLDIQGRGDGVAHDLGIGLPVPSRAHVGHLVVHDDGLNGTSGGEAGFPDYDGGAGELVLSKDGRPAVRGSVGKVNDGPLDGQVSHRWSLDRNERPRRCPRSESGRKRRGARHVLQVLLLGFERREFVVGVAAGSKRGRGGRPGREDERGSRRRVLSDGGGGRRDIAGRRGGYWRRCGEGRGDARGAEKEQRSRCRRRLHGSFISSIEIEPAGKVELFGFTSFLRSETCSWRC
mmetsp:Transcript_63078/g.186357  ORF Transcript_63078/g.186357 Transcript_63078/m.186357 type:complete len:237 (-) Transcript_63078:108-818(-)